MAMNWLRGLRRDPSAEDALRSVPAATEPAPPPAAPTPAPLPTDPPEAWAEAACATGDKALAAEWAARVEGEALLAGIATRCRFAEVRLAVVRRIADPEVLRRVAEASRERDKHVYRHCTERLRAQRQEGERARRAVDLAVALHALLEATPVAISHLLQIEKELASLGEGGAETAECEALLVKARARVLSETQAQIELRARLTEAQALSAAIAAAAAPDEAALEAWRAQAAEVARLAELGPGWLAALPAARSLAQALDGIDAMLRAAQEAREAQARAAAEAVQRAEAQARAAEADAAARAAAPAPARRVEIDRAALALLAGLEQHLEEGRTTEAEAALKALERMLEGGSPPGQIARRLQRARAQLARLSAWARWGTERAREQLIGVAEALLRGEPDVAERARAVPLLRREWKNLDAHGPASQAAWKRFDRALEKAYKPVAELRAAEAAAHAAAREARESLCAGWEAWLEAQPAGEPDARALEAKRDEMIAAWRAAPKTGFKDERKLRKRFDVLLEKVDAPLEAARAAELARREALVAEAQALVEAPDLARAMSAAKTLQRRWKDEARAVHLRQGADQKLWQRFRRACDAVFARRDAELAAQATEREAREQARHAEREAAQALEAQKQKKHAERFARVAAAAPGAEGLGEAQAAQGLAKRGAMLVDLEIALDLPTPDAHSAERSARMLARLQERFRAGAAAALDPEALVAQWYAIAAPPDAGQAARIDAVVRALLERPRGPQPRRASRS